MKIKKALFGLMAILAIAVGIYPWVFLLLGLSFEIYNPYENRLLSSLIWDISFYTHTTFGGIALLVGWAQFSDGIRSNYIKVHRQIGIIYVLTVLISSLGGIYIGLFSKGGIITSIAFVSLGLIWFYSTLMAYLKVRTKDIIAHKKLMIYSYAACLAAVSLRIWNPLLDLVLNDGELAYQIASWLAWAPNLLVAHIIIIRMERDSN